MTTRALYFPKGTFDGIVVSDPLYGPDVKYRFSRKIVPVSKFDTGFLLFYNLKTGKVEGYDTVSLDLLVVRQLNSLPFDMAVRLDENGQFQTGMPTYQKGRTTTTEIGVDSASIFIGSQSVFKADSYSSCIHTGGDGFLGTVDDLSVTQEDWDRYRNLVMQKYHRLLDPTFPLGGKSSWYATHVSLDFDGSLLSEEYIDSMVRANFTFKTVPVELPVSIGSEWVMLGTMWKQAGGNTGV